MTATQRVADATRGPTAETARLEAAGALGVLRAGLAASPELRAGVAVSISMATLSALGKLAIPVVIQVIVDRGLIGDDGYRPGLVASVSILAAVLVVAVTVLGILTNRRLVRIAQRTLYGLRTRAFERIHRLSIADQNERRRGELVSRITSDIETLARFAEWGAIAWIIQPVLIVGGFVLMAWYSWPVALVVAVVFAPMVPLFRALQRRQLAAYDEQRTRVGETLSEFSESVGGAAVIRAYGVQDRTLDRLDRRIRAQYRAEMRGARYFALTFPVSDIIGSIALAAAVVVGVRYGGGWGLDAGELIAVVYLVNLLLGPIAELSEVLNETQTALAGWRKVLVLLATPVDLVEADDGPDLSTGPLSVEATGVGFRYRTGGDVLSDVDLRIEAGQAVAIVGETGSGKTTFAKLLCRLADPTAGTVHVDGMDLRDVPAAARRRAIRMVPQDGFLFDTTIRENVRFGRPDAEAHHVDAAFEELGLAWWVRRLPLGLDTPVGERGEALSVGERQLVALARAELADPGLLILDEATSNVDPETERALSEALVRLSRGRTTVSIAHRLSTAEAADRVLVFDTGRLVEDGAHHELVAAGGRYAEMHRSWVRNVTAAGAG